MLRESGFLPRLLMFPFLGIELGFLAFTTLKNMLRGNIK